MLRYQRFNDNNSFTNLTWSSYSKKIAQQPEISVQNKSCRILRNNSTYAAIAYATFISCVLSPLKLQESKSREVSVLDGSRECKKMSTWIGIGAYRRLIHVTCHVSIRNTCHL